MSDQISGEGFVFSTCNYMSLAPYGREELLLQESSEPGVPAAWQIYQPELGRRFRFSTELLTTESMQFASISSPNGPIGTEDYYGGHIAYMTTEAVTRSHVLTPVPLTP